MSNDRVKLDAPTFRQRTHVFLLEYRTALVVIASVVLASACLFRHFQKSHGSAGAQGIAPDSPNGPVPVSVASATVGDIQLRIPALGTVTPLATVTVRTQISGTLQRIAFSEGQFVHPGDVIAQIDPRPYQAALQQIQGNLLRDRALLANSKMDLRRYEGLVKEDSIAMQQLDTQRALVDEYEGTIEADEGQLKTAEVNLAYTRIVSPISGRVGLRQVDQGNYVTPGDANGIVVINQMQPITVIFPIPEDNVPAIDRRLHEGSILAVEAYDRTNSVKLAEGKLLTLDNQIDTATGTVKLRALFGNADDTLFPNQFVNIQLLQELLQHQIIIPNAAVRRGAPNGVVGSFVYLVKPDHKVAVQPVSLGVVDGERVAVTAGLAAGALVVTEGGDRLRDGARVQLPQETPARPVSAPPLGTPPAATKGLHRARSRTHPSQ